MAARDNTASPFALRADGLCKSYGVGTSRIAALREVSLAIETGEMVAIMGPSGSGKSTLLHLLGGLDAPDVGSVVIAGRALAEMSDDELTVFRRRHVGFVFQSFNLVPMLTAAENVALPLQLDGVPRAAVWRRVGEVLEAVGMEARHSHAPDRLSGGEMQRIALARALVVEPSLILADEPTGSLDSRSSEEILRLLRHAATALGRAVVMITHDVRAAAYAERIIRVVDGVILDDREERRAAAGSSV